MTRTMTGTRTGMMKVRYASHEACQEPDALLDRGYHTGQPTLLQDSSREWHASAITLAEKYERAVARSRRDGETSVVEHLPPSYRDPLWRVLVPVSSNFIAIRLLLMALS